MSFPELGAIVGGKYRLLRQLGEGGMATVFEVENTLTSKRAAIKWVHPQFSEPERGMQRLVHEARASSRIRHDNVVTVYDVLEEGRSVFLVMELLDGEPLGALLQRAKLPMHALIALLLPALRGVAAAHAAGVVHRDVKPDNIFLAEAPGYDSPVPKVIDFGISKMFEADSAHVTRSGITMGTPRYVSYEQLLGARDVDARTDLYAFGVILYEALTGRPPYDEANSFGEQAVCFATQIPAPPKMLRDEIPLQLDAVVQRAIAKHRDDRFASMDELISALEPFARAESYPVPLLSLSSERRRASEERVDPQASTESPSGVSLAGSQQSSRRADQDEPAAAPTRSSLPERRARRRRALVLALGITALGGVAFLLSARESRPAAHARVKILTPDVDGGALSEPVTRPDTGSTSAAHAPAVMEVDAGAATFSASELRHPKTISPQRGKQLGTEQSRQAETADAPRPTTPSKPRENEVLDSPAVEQRYRAGRVRRAEF